VQFEGPVGYSECGAGDLVESKVEGRGIPAALPDPLDPDAITTWPGYPELEAPGGTGDGSGSLLPALIEQDDKRLQQWCCVGVSHGAAEYLLGCQQVAAREKRENSNGRREALHFSAALTAANSS
jgi:hypothetical protein